VRAHGVCRCCFPPRRGVGRGVWCAQITGGFSWSITFRCPAAAPFPLLVPNNLDVIFGSGAADLTSSRARLASVNVGGSFAMSIAQPSGPPLVTDAIPFDADPWEIEVAMREVLSQQQPQIEVMTNWGNALWGRIWYIRVVRPYGDFPAVTLDTSLLTGEAVALVLTVVEHGSTDLFLDPAPSDLFQVRRPRACCRCVAWDSWVT
jgi:hypothetical protein